MMFVHFTDEQGAHGIVESLTLRSGMTCSAYAVAVGGRFVPSVQHTTCGVATARDHAVLFTTDVEPIAAFVEECAFAVDDDGVVKLTDAAIIDVADAVALLDGTNERLID